MKIAAPPAPSPRLSLAVTGHRDEHPDFATNRAAIEQVLTGLFDQIETVAKQATSTAAPTRLHSLLVGGTDQMAMALGKARGWELVAPLPFGRELNVAINAAPLTLADGQALLTGGTADDPAVQARAQSLRGWTDASHVFAMAERDSALAALLTAKLAAPQELHAAQAFSFAASERVALAARVMIEQSDVLIALWDGTSTSFTGGTGATVAQALDMGCPVVWVNVRDPAAWRLLFSAEALAGLHAGMPQAADREALLDSLLRDAVGAGAHAKAAAHGSYAAGQAALSAKRWRARSSRLWHGYRRIEALFGADTAKARLRNLRQTYETPEAILSGSAQPLLAATIALPGQDHPFAERIKAGSRWQSQRLGWTGE